MDKHRRNRRNGPNEVMDIVDVPFVPIVNEPVPDVHKSSTGTHMGSDSKKNYPVNRYFSVCLGITAQYKSN